MVSARCLCGRAPRYALMQQRYVLANPFAGIKVRGASRAAPLAATRVFAEGEWSMIQTVAEGRPIGSMHTGASVCEAEFVGGCAQPLVARP
ncbi:hypothetical protein J7E70_29070 [Variovorax paradoxus]|nr:hypothetical protein [Variovorax paradoxus]MBT2304483.1 hypothetical protein [Variovorax paradoxus]